MIKNSRKEILKKYYVQIENTNKKQDFPIINKERETLNEEVYDNNKFFD